MPNWCMSTVAVNGPKNELDILEKELEQALSSNPSGSDFGNMWLGNILLHLGWTKTDIFNSDMRCRGECCNIERGDDEQLCVQIMSAWAPHLGPVVEFVKKFAPSCEIIYTADELGHKIHISNDPCVVGTYFVDCHLTGEEYRALGELSDPLTKQELLERISDFVGMKYRKNLDAAVAAVKKKLANTSRFEVIRYDYCPVEECV